MMAAKDSPHLFEWEQRIAGDSRWARVLMPVAIVAATFLAYVATVDLGFVYDDQVLILTNDSIRSWGYFPSYFTSHLWSSHFPSLLSNAYRPILLIWLRLNDMLFGLHAWGWHLSSVAAHVAVTYLVYRLGVRLTRDTWMAGAGALVFGLHPVHVETIAEASWADQPLSTLLVLATVLTWWRSRQGGRRAAGLAASVALCGAALLSKESSLMLPVLISAYAWTEEGASGREVAEGRRALFERLRSCLWAAIPFWGVVLAYLPLRIWALKGFTHVVTPLSWSQEVFTLPSVLLFYARLLIWPSGLSCYYDTPTLSSPSWQGFFLPAVLLAVMAAGLAYWYKRTRQSQPEEAGTLAFACLWIVLTLLPVLNFRLLLEGEIAHDRYLYLPSVGFALLVAIALRQAVGGAARHLRPAGALLGALALFGAMGVATARQCLFWSDDLVLSVRAHEIAPHNVTATTSLAAAVAERGMYGQAMALYQQALAIQPNFWVANRNLAYLYYAQGDFPEAVRYFARSCAVGPEEGDQFLYLGLALLRMGRLAEAEKAVRSALVLRPQGKNYHLSLGTVLRQEGRLPEAKQELEVELSEDAQNAEAKTLLEEINQQMQAGKPEEPPQHPSVDIK